MKLSVYKSAFVALFGACLTGVSAPATAQTVVNPDDVMYLMPSLGSWGTSTTVAALQAHVNDLQAALGPDGPYVKLGFTAFIGFAMTDWSVNTSNPAAMAEAIQSTVAQIDAVIATARQVDGGAGIPAALNILTQARDGYDGAQMGSENEDVRSMQWYADNDVARGWWSTSRYNRKKRLIVKAYADALGKVLANRMSMFPNTLVAASGDGEVELAFTKPGTTEVYADYSPFAIAEFRDWLRNGGLYASGREFAGQGYADAAKYAGSDGLTLFNQDFGTTFTSWNLRHFDWDVPTSENAPSPDPGAISLATYLGGGFVKLPAGVTGGFDAPRSPKAVGTINPFWDVWVLFKQTMLQRHNTEYAQWITTAVDAATKTTVGNKKWYSYQIAGDYLFNGTPENPNARFHSSASSLMTADITPYGGLGITAFNLDFTQPSPCYTTPPNFVASTLVRAAPAISARRVRWAVIEWHPGLLAECSADNFAGGVSPNQQLFRDEMAIIEQYGPSYLAPFIWDTPLPRNQIKGTHFATELKAMVARLKNGRASDVRIATDIADGATIRIPLAGLSFTGSAIDLGKVRGTAHGTGVDQVTITLTRGTAVITQTVSYGLARTDIATNGAQFAAGGFSTNLPRLLEGQYQVTIGARSTVGAKATTTKTMTITIVYRVTSSPSALQFGATRPPGGAAVNTFSAPQVLTPTYGGFATPSYTAAVAPGASWLSVVSGPNPGQFTVTASNPSNVVGTSDSLSSSITITGSVGGAIVVPVTLTVKDAAASPLPFGSFDTPANGATGLAGSIQFSGWGLDDVGVSRVEIWRDRATGEPTPVFNSPGHLGHGKILVETIQSTAFIEGARPDVASQYPNNPAAHKAGWGYLLLSTGIEPNQGNGTYTFHAFVYDIDGRGTSLGSKTIGLNNAGASRPFGNIDTPSNGQVITESFWNFGWALTPNATPTCTIVNNGIVAAQGVFYSVDSGPLTRVLYGDNRTDIAAAFPGYSNGTGAGGAFYFNFTEQAAVLTPGIHVLGWFVQDNCGRADGIGSRFINVIRSSGTTPLAAPVSTAVAPAGSEPIYVVRSFGEPQRVDANASGVRVISVANDERVEVRLPSRGVGAYEGYQVVNGVRRPLPIGSSLAASDGVFYWQPVAGFLGAFELEFIGIASQGPETTRMRVVVGPSMRLVVDTPQPNAVVGSSFAIGGWILDLAGEHGGVDAVDVWAYRVTPGGTADAQPIYLGAAAYGGSRPDVAALYGTDFTDTAYDLVASGLAPGTYDVVVYGRRASTGTFDAAQSVRIVVR